MIRRMLAALATASLGLLLLAPAAGADTHDANQAVAVNTEDGASVFRLAFSIRRIHDGVVDQTNTAVAVASCTDCQTVALALQVVLVSGDVDVVVPQNEAFALNVACAECLTYASATQLVLGVDGPTHLTSDGYRRLARVQQDLRALEAQLAELDAAALHTAVQAAKAEVLAVFTEELVEAGPPPADDDEGTGTTTTTSPAPSSSSTSSTTTTTTSATAPSSTTTSTTVVTTTTTVDGQG